MDHLEDVWATRDFPVLVEVARRIDAGERFFRMGAVAEVVNMSVDDVVRAGDALERRGLVRIGRVMRAESCHFDDVSGEAYLLTGLHPDGDDLVTRLVQAAVQAAELTDDPEEKTRLRRFADSAVTVSREVMSGVLTAVLSRGMLGA